jgi:heat shock protein HslJ
VNYASGFYQIISDKNIVIYDYDVSTAVCCESDFDEQLLDMLNDVTYYSCKNNKLTFLIDENNKIIFSKH